MDNLFTNNNKTYNQHYWKEKKRSRHMALEIQVLASVILKANIVKLDFIYLYFEWEFPSLRTSVRALRIILP
jgi:hypothetical protein